MYTHLPTLLLLLLLLCLLPLLHDLHNLLLPPLSPLISEPLSSFCPLLSEFLDILLAELTNDCRKVTVGLTEVGPAGSAVFEQLQKVGSGYGDATHTLIFTPGFFSSHFVRNLTCRTEAVRPNKENQGSDSEGRWESRHGLTSSLYLSPPFALFHSIVACTSSRERTP